MTTPSPLRPQHPHDGSGTSVLISPLLAGCGFSHGFFTRRGGFSARPFDSLNFSVSVGDTAESVQRNMQVAAEHLGVTPGAIYFLAQVHGNECVSVHGTERQADVWQLEADALCGAPSKGSALDPSRYAVAVRTADCVPILIGCRNSRITAACHAGWRGCVSGVVLATVARLRDLGASHLVAAIGPHISMQAFEVSAEVAHALAAASPDADIVDWSGARPHVDLRKMVRSQLRQAGLPDEDIEDVHGCTLTDGELFYSHRRDGKNSGRHLSAIVPGPAR